MKIEFEYENKKAKDVKLNDYIKSFNIETEKNEPKKVLELFEPYVESDRQITIDYKNGEVTVSKTHPLLVKRDNKWTYIDTQLAKIGDIVKTSSGITDIVDLKSSNQNPNFIDFTIEDNNNYYAGDTPDHEQIVVHNSCAVYFQWWHIDFHDLVVLKSNGGTEESRARGLKYTVKINQLLIDRWLQDEEVSLFDPKDVPELFNITGDEFNEKYKEYENKVSLKRKTYKARDLMYSIMKERSETGNIYLFHEENVNNHNMVNRYINTSNLCVANDTTITIKYDNTIMDIHIDQLGWIMGKYENVEVLSYNLNSGEKEFKLITSFVETHSNKEVIKITDIKSGKFIECTEDHEFFTSNRGIVKAKDLDENDQLIL